MSIRYNIVIQKEDSWYVAKCLDNNVASQGKTIEEALNNLKEAINSLKPEYQRAVYLADIEELSYKEIGQIMNKTESGIKVLIHRARKSLEQVVRKEAGKYEG